MYNTPIFFVRFSLTFSLFAPIPNKVKETVRRDFDKQQGATFLQVGAGLAGLAPGLPPAQKSSVQAQQTSILRLYTSSSIIF
jgi:hypothetical protein